MSTVGNNDMGSIVSSGTSLLPLPDLSNEISGIPQQAEEKCANLQTANVIEADVNEDST